MAKAENAISIMQVANIVGLGRYGMQVIVTGLQLYCVPGHLMLALKLIDIWKLVFVSHLF
jgi:hypothetical protein